MRQFSSRRWKLGQHWPSRLVAMAAEFGHHKDRTPTHGYAATREAAMAAFVKSLAAGVGQYIQGFLRRH